MSNFDSFMKAALRDVPIQMEKDPEIPPTLIDKIFGKSCRWCGKRRQILSKSMCRECFVRYSQNNFVFLERRIEALEKGGGT